MEIDTVFAAKDKRLCHKPVVLLCKTSSNAKSGVHARTQSIGTAMIYKNLQHL